MTRKENKECKTEGMREVQGEKKCKTERQSKKEIMRGGQG